MQKFTRPITREVELAGHRLAFTLSEQGVAVRPVGSRKPPWEMTWGAVLRHLAGHSHNPSGEEITQALETLKQGQPSQPASTDTHTHGAGEHAHAAEHSHAGSGGHSAHPQ